jgi:acetylornithine deacetylase
MPMMHATERRVLDAIDDDAILRLLTDLVAFQSVGGAETPAQRQMAAHMEAAGLAVDTWALDLDRLRQHPAYTVDIERDAALGVTGQWGRGDGPRLVLNGHIDVVPIGEERRWTYPPWTATVVDNHVYGRGTADMKGALSCALAAIQALIEVGVSLDGSVVLQSVIGEEDGGVGTLAAIERGVDADAAIVMEPTELMVAPAQAGALSFRITVPGAAAHGALRTEGVDPIDKLIPLYRALQAFEAERNSAVDDPLFDAYEVPFALCIGTIRGGEWPSSVAESVVCKGRLGIGPHEDVRAVQLAFEKTVESAADADAWLREHPPTVDWWGAQFAPAQIPSDHPVVTTVADAVADITEKPATLQGMPYGADMRLLVNQGHIPTVLFGPGDIRTAHAPDERVSISDLRTATEVLALTILRFCGGLR